MMKRVLSLAIMLFLGVAPVAVAQTVLQPDTVLSDALTDDDLSFTPDGQYHWPYDCYVVDAPAGEAWEVVVTTDYYVDILLKSGLECSGNDGIGSQPIDEKELNIMTFISGGGRYYLSVKRHWAVEYRSDKRQDYKRQDYQIVLRRAAKAPKRLKMVAPGIVPRISPTSPGAASIAAAGDPTAVESDQIFTDCAICPEMVVIPSGTFVMGSMALEEARGKDEGPRHTVTFASPFAMGRTEVTFDQWNACVAAGGCKTRPGDQGWGQGDRPVVDVSWLDAMAYAQWLSQSTGQRYFLPTESEWEYAARAGTDTPWNTGDAIVTDDANMLGEFGRTAPVAGFPPNAFSLHDMHGNVAEWVQDCHDMGYFGAPLTGAAAWKPDCPLRVQRGGSWADEPAQLRSAARKGGAAGARSPKVGFRVARAL